MKSAAASSRPTTRPSQPSGRLNAEEAISAAAEYVAQGNLEAAIDTVNKTMEAGHGNGALSALRQLLDQTNRKKMELIDSYGNEIGNVITVDLIRPSSGRIKAKITDVDAHNLTVHYVLQNAGNATGAKKTFKYDDLSITERVLKLRKMGGDREPAANMIMGLVAVESRANDRAKQYFRKVEIFGPMVIEAMNELN